MEIKRMSCTCKYNNPKVTATAICIKNNKLMVVKRAIEPFKNEWDFVGGFANAGEDPEQTLRREVKEELGVEIKRLYPIGVYPGTFQFGDKDIQIASHAFLIDIDDPILSDNENSEIDWQVPDTIAFDSNQLLLKKVKTMLDDIERVRELVKQLDDTAKVDEYKYYEAQLRGIVSRIYDDDKLLAMGWVFPRQTMLRLQGVVEDMIVDESLRGKGYGKLLMQNLIKASKEAGIEVLELTTNPKRVAANELYKKQGFFLHVTNHYLLNLD